MLRKTLPRCTGYMYTVLRLAKLGILFREASGNWISDPWYSNIGDPWPSAARACFRRGWIETGPYSRDTSRYKLTPRGRRAMKEYSDA